MSLNAVIKSLEGIIDELKEHSPSSLSDSVHVTEAINKPRINSNIRESERWVKLIPAVNFAHNLDRQDTLLKLKDAKEPFIVPVADLAKTKVIFILENGQQVLEWHNYKYKITDFIKEKVKEINALKGLEVIVVLINSSTLSWLG